MLRLLEDDDPCGVCDHAREDHVGNEVWDAFGDSGWEYEACTLEGCACERFEEPIEGV